MQISKYNANGNDFVIFHALKKEDRSELARKLCNRQSGIGADGMIVVLWHDREDYEWEFYNSDGSEANMCGNGSRAVALYAVDNFLAPKNHTFLSGAGVIEAEVDGVEVKVKLTKPKVLGEVFEKYGLVWHFYDTGVPHLVTYVEDLSTYNKELASKMRYEYNSNVNFAKIEKDCIRVRTYERGVEDETLACGTGMAASFFGAFGDGRVGEQSIVYPTSGEKLELSYKDEYIFFRGEVQRVFSTTIDV